MFSFDSSIKFNFYLNGFKSNHLIVIIFFAPDVVLTNTILGMQ